MRAWLCTAAGGGHAATVEVLLRHGANVHALEDRALRWAAGKGHSATVELLLLAHGADVRALNDEALCRAARDGHSATVEALLAHGADAPRPWNCYVLPALSKIMALCHSRRGVIHIHVCAHQKSFRVGTRI
jgi:NAD(P)-dependent dehydrogenase (short-subunit alcohol dehydrogenase family)